MELENYHELSGFFAHFLIDVLFYILLNNFSIILGLITNKRLAYMHIKLMQEQEN